MRNFDIIYSLLASFLIGFLVGSCALSGQNIAIKRELKKINRSLDAIDQRMDTLDFFKLPDKTHKKALCD